MKLAAHRAGHLAAALGGGLLLAIFILLNLPALRRIFASIKSVLRSVTRGDICFIATILAAVNLLVFIYAKNSSTYTTGTTPGIGLSRVNLPNCGKTREQKGCSRSFSTRF